MKIWNLLFIVNPSICPPSTSTPFDILVSVSQPLLVPKTHFLFTLINLTFEVTFFTIFYLKPPGYNDSGNSSNFLYFIHYPSVTSKNLLFIGLCLLLNPSVTDSISPSIAVDMATSDIVPYFTTPTRQHPVTLTPPPYRLWSRTSVDFPSLPSTPIYTDVLLFQRKITDWTVILVDFQNSIIQYLFIWNWSFGKNLPGDDSGLNTPLCRKVTIY